MSPGITLKGRKKPCFSKRNIYFVSYVLMYTGTKNNMKSRSVPEISLRDFNDAGG